MDVEFASSRMTVAGQSISEATRLLGVPIGRQYIQRLAILRAVDKFSDLYGHRALRLHALRGDRAGQFAISLTANFRLILERLSEDSVRILSVEDYHGG